MLKEYKKNMEKKLDEGYKQIKENYDQAAEKAVKEVEKINGYFDFIKDLRDSGNDA